MKKAETPNPFSIALLQWFADNGRELPWRATRNPYYIWLSEIILQQTRIEQGRPYWERFVQRWPSVEALATATEDEVLREWQGLGYYSRARNLHVAAQQIVDRGGFPDTFEGLRALKGIGDYTAAAIGSIAFDLPVAVVDGNVYRVLSRYFGITTPINSSEGKREFAALAQRLLPEKEASAFNQAMMDFGAIQCTPHSPCCLLCPVQDSCIAFNEGKVAQLPVKLKRLQVKERRLVYIYIRYKGQTVLRRRGAGDIWQGLWESYGCDQLQGSSDEWVAHFMESLPPSADARLSLIRRDVVHVLTHRRLHCDFYLLETSARPTLPSEYLWIDEILLEKYALPRLLVLLFQLLTTK